jgi:hypothetical protein
LKTFGTNCFVHLLKQYKKYKMKILRHSFFLLASFLSVTALQAQTADDIIAKHIEAIGGREKLSGIKSVQYENTLQVQGNDAPSKIVIVNGKGYRSESEVNGQKMVQVYTDKGGWAVNPLAGTEPQTMADEQYKAGAEQIYAVPFLDYAARGSKAELLGQEKVGDVNAYKIKLTNANNVSTTYFIDPATYYVVKTIRSAEMMGQQVDVTVNYSDFKKTDYGWVVPQALQIDMGGQFSLTAKVNKVEVNKPVDSSVFNMPGKQ